MKWLKESLAVYLRDLWEDNIKPRRHIWIFAGVAIIMLVLIVEGVI